MKIRFFSTIYTKILLTVFIAVILWQFFIIFTKIKETSLNFTFSLFYSIIPLGGSLLGFLNSHRWGGFASSVGRSVFFLSAGIFAWSIGNLIFSYYNIVLHIAIPYPSLADVFFVLIYPFSLLGIANLFRVTGALFAVRKISSKFVLFFSPLIVGLFLFYLLFVVARGGEIKYDGDLLKLFLDILFPIGSTLIIMFTIVIYRFSAKLLGGVFRMPIILILAGFVSNFLADFLFSYTTTTETYFVGMWVDVFYPTAFFLISFGLVLLDPRLAKKNN